MTIIPYTNDWQEAWDTFVARSRNGTFFHTRAFLSYHKRDRFTDASLLFMDGEKILGVLPAAMIEEERKRILASHPGASYGGLVLSDQYGMKETGEMISALLTYAKDQKFDGIRFLRLTPTSVRKQASDDQEYWLYQSDFRVFRFELATALDLRSVESDDVLSSFDGKCRNAVRQAERAGVEVRWTDDIDAFWPMLEATLSGRHDVKPTHTLEEFKRLQQAGGDAVRLLGAFDGDILIGGIAVMTLHSQALYTLYIAQDYAHAAKRPIHALVAELVRQAILEERSAIHFGISTEAGGTIANEGLFFFKESFGGASIRHESWELDLSSLS
jgi:hypothetical protein